jgi:hypothetical protein
MEGFLDLGDQALVFENALVGKDGEFPGSRIVHHSPTGIFIVLRVARNLPSTLELFPNTKMVAGMYQVVPIRLGFAKRRTVDDQLAIYEPKDSEMPCTI